MGKYRIFSNKLSSKKDLSRVYGLQWRTLARRLEECYDIVIPKNQRILSPAQVEQIMNALGRPSSH